MTTASSTAIPPDWILRAGHILTMGPLGDLLDGAIAVAGDTIVDLGPYAEIRARYPEVPVHGSEYGTLLPGLINTHTHFSEGLITGIGEQWTIWEWGQNLLVPTGRLLTREMAKVGALLRAYELLASGVTTVSDMFCHTHPDEFASLGVVDALESIEMRGVVCYGAENAFEGCEQSLDRIMAEHEALAARAAETGRVDFRLGVGTILGQTEALFHRSIEAAKANQWAVHTHLAEVREEKVTARLKWGCSTVEYAAREGLLDQPTLAAHGIWLTPEEMKLLNSFGVAIVHNPQANMILASGVCNVGLLRSTGLKVSLGTDGAASNDSQNLLETIKLAALLQKLHHLEPSIISARDVLQMATIDAAASLGIADRVGSLEVGKQADLTFFAGDSPGAAIVHDPAQQIVYGAGSSDVTDVWVAGKQLLKDRRPTTVDLPALLATARPLARKLATKAKLKDLSCLA